jgi:hypothetical protein
VKLQLNLLKNRASEATNISIYFLNNLLLSFSHYQITTFCKAIRDFKQYFPAHIIAIVEQHIAKENDIEVAKNAGRR